jgi:hypothetical protein
LPAIHHGENHANTTATMTRMLDFGCCMFDFGFWIFCKEEVTKETEGAPRWALLSDDHLVIDEATH